MRSSAMATPPSPPSTGLGASATPQAAASPSAQPSLPANTRRGRQPSSYKCLAKVENHRCVAEGCRGSFANKQASRLFDHFVRKQRRGGAVGAAHAKAAAEFLKEDPQALAELAEAVNMPAPEPVCVSDAEEIFTQKRLCQLVAENGLCANHFVAGKRQSMQDLARHIIALDPTADYVRAGIVIAGEDELKDLFARMPNHYVSVCGDKYTLYKQGRLLIMVRIEGEDAIYLIGAPRITSWTTTRSRAFSSSSTRRCARLARLPSGAGGSYLTPPTPTTRWRSMASYRWTASQTACGTSSSPPTISRVRARHRPWCHPAPSTW
jgi:hypothetical protein